MDRACGARRHNALETLAAIRIGMGLNPLTMDIGWRISSLVTPFLGTILSTDRHTRSRSSHLSAGFLSRGRWEDDLTQKIEQRGGRE